MEKEEIAREFKCKNEDTAVKETVHNQELVLATKNATEISGSSQYACELNSSNEMKKSEQASTPFPAEKIQKVMDGSEKDISQLFQNTKMK